MSAAGMCRGQSFGLARRGTPQLASVSAPPLESQVSTASSPPPSSAANIISSWLPARLTTRSAGPGQGRDRTAITPALSAPRSM